MRQENGLKRMEYDIMFWTGSNEVGSTAKMGWGRTRQWDRMRQE
jgi:hypothetical protein